MVTTILDAISDWNWTALAAVSSATMAVFTGASLFYTFKTQRLTVKSIRDEMDDRRRLAKSQARKISIRSKIGTLRENFRTGVETTQFSAYLNVEVENKSNDAIDHVDVELPNAPVMPVSVPHALVADRGSFGQQRSMPRAPHPTLTYCSEAADETDPVRAVKPHRRRFFALPDLLPGEVVELSVWIPAPKPSEPVDATVKFTTANSRRFCQDSGGEPEEIE